MVQRVRSATWILSIDGSRSLQPNGFTWGENKTGKTLATIDDIFVVSWVFLSRAVLVLDIGLGRLGQGNGSPETHIKFHRFHSIFYH